MSLTRIRVGRGSARAVLNRMLSPMVAVALLTAACGGGTPDDTPSGAAAAAPEVPAATLDVSSTRTYAGIIAAGGDAAAFGASECDMNRTFRLAYIGPDLSELDTVGLGSLVLEEPSQLIAAYLTDLNANGGLHGRCVQSSVHLWSWTSPEESFERICARVAAESPIVVLSLFGDLRGVQCLTSDAGLPMLGLHASVPTTVQRRSRGNLFLDDGTYGHLLGVSIQVARATGAVPGSGQVGLLYGRPLGASGSREEFNIGADFDHVAQQTGDFNLIPGVIAHVPVQFGQLSLLGPEARVRLLESGLTAAEIAASGTEQAALDSEQRAVLAAIEQFYLDTVTQFRDKGVAAVYATAPWFELRRMMRAAERIGWYPTWIANDVQGATLTLTGAPRAQTENFFLVSSRRAAGDAIAGIDRGCVGLRNSAVGTPPFEHRHHSDAWNLLVATCDALDVTLGALSRVSGPMSAAAFRDQLLNTDYAMEYGGALFFGHDEFSGATRFRLLEADPTCVLDSWGCTRATSPWSATHRTAHAQQDGSSQQGQPSEDGAA